MAATYRLGRWRRAVNVLVRGLLALGVPLPCTFLLTVPGRRTGRPLSTPVTLVEDGGRRWLVAPYGAVGWVRNARAAGRVTLSRGRHRETVPITEVEGVERGRVLKTYVTRVPVTRPFFDARPDAAVEVFVAEGDRHPVFRLGDAGA